MPNHKWETIRVFNKRIPEIKEPKFSSAPVRIMSQCKCQESSSSKFKINSLDKAHRYTGWPATHRQICYLLASVARREPILPHSTECLCQREGGWRSSPQTAHCEAVNEQSVVSFPSSTDASHILSHSSQTIFPILHKHACFTLTSIC